MSEEAIGTLKEDVISIDEQDKENLINLSVIATNDVIVKKGKNRKPKKTTVELTEKMGIKYQIVAINENSSPPGVKVEHMIQSIGLETRVTDNLIEKYNRGEITQNHVRDLRKINTIDSVNMLDLDTQMKIVNNIIENRNDQNDVNSSDVALFLAKNGKVNKFIIDNWYRGVLRLIVKINKYTDIDKSIISNLSSKQLDILKIKIKELISRLEALILFLEEYRKN